MSEVKVKLRVNCGSEWPAQWKEGETVAVSMEMAERMVRAGVGTIIMQAIPRDTESVGRSRQSKAIESTKSEDGK